MSFIVWLAIAVSLSIGVELQSQAAHNRDREQSYRKLLIFQSQLEKKLGENTELFKGVIAHLSVSEVDLPEDTEAVMDYILSRNSLTVRNVGILKDTTIIFNSPTQPNSSTIGVDLSTVEGQSTDVLRVKDSLEDVFIGPVNLVQGGSGFIIRQAILRSDQYWGQIAIVLNADLFASEVAAIASHAGLRYALYESSQATADRIVGDVNVPDRNPLSTNIQIYGSSWTLSVVPIEGWIDYTRIRNLGFIGAAVLALVPAILLLLLLKTRAQLHVQAVHDSLTGLYNRNFFQQYHPTLMARAKRQNEKLGIAIIDMNYFKEINDTHGHLAGDAVLKTAAAKLKDQARDSDMIYRFGGDEFLVCLSHINGMSDLKAAGTRLRKILNFSIEYKGTTIQAHASVGIAEYPDDAENIDHLLLIADSAMYEEKARLRAAANKT